MALDVNKAISGALNQLDSINNQLQSLYSDVIVDIEAQKAFLRKLYEDEDNAKEEYKKYSLDVSSLDNLRASIEKLNADRMVVEEETKTVVTESKKKQISATAKIKEKETRLAELAVQTAELEKKVADSTKTLIECQYSANGLTLEQERLQKKIDDLNKRLSELDAALKAGENTQLELLRKNDEEKKENETLNGSKQSLSDTIEQLNNAIAEKEIEITFKQKELAELSGNVEKFNQEQAEKWQEKEREFNDSLLEISIKEQELVQREADLSLKENKMRDTVNQMMKYKAYVEKRLGETTPPLDI